jgi:hypothetical protein
MVKGKRGNKARPTKDLSEMKNILRIMWIFQGFSVRKMSRVFNDNPEYVQKYGTVSVSSVTSYVKEFRRDAEKWYDEDAVEKYAAEFVRKQHTIDEQVDRIDDVQRLIDTSDPKERELFLKFEMAKHTLHQDQIKMMSEIELVLHIKRLNKERRIKNETIIALPDENKDTVIAKRRGYLNVNTVEESDGDKSIS